jgi:hypothetical protein
MCKRTKDIERALRVRQALELCRLAGRNPDNWLPPTKAPSVRALQERALLAAFGLDQPEDWQRLPLTSWQALLELHPDLLPKMPLPQRLPSWLVSRILHAHPQFASLFPRTALNLSGSCWCHVLQAQPQLEHLVKNWSCLSMFDWGSLLCVQPQMIRHKPRYLQLLPEQWMYVLCQQPQLAPRVKNWENWGSQHWATLLHAQPQLVKYKRRYQRRSTVRTPQQRGPHDEEA